MKKTGKIFLGCLLTSLFISINDVKASESDCNQTNIEIKKDDNGRDLFYYEQVFIKYEDETCIYRVVKVVEYAYYNEDRKIISETGYFKNNNVSYKIKRNFHNNGSLKSVNSKDYYTTGNLKKNVNYSDYSKDKYKKRTISKYNSKKIRNYYAVLIRHSNFKTKSNTVSNYYNNKKLKSRTHSTYNTKGERTYYKKSLNYSDGKAKSRQVYSNYTAGVWKNYKKTDYRKVGKKIYKKKSVISQRKANKVKKSIKRYYYNKKGQLKSNKNGNAYRKHYKYFSNDKISKYYKHKYSEGGKLKRITYKYYSKNNPNLTELEKMADEIIALTNAERKKKGIHALARNEKLMKGAKIRAKELKYCFSHTRPNKKNGCQDGKSYVTIFAEVNYKGSIYGENAALRGVSDLKGNGKAIYDQWYNSPGHYQNMINKSMDDVGVGLYYNETTKTLYAIQLFGGQD